MGGVALAGRGENGDEDADAEGAAELVGGVAPKMVAGIAAVKTADPEQIDRIVAMAWTGCGSASRQQHARREPILYSLPMSEKVKGHTRVSSKHQVTIPAGAFRDAGFAPGDTLKVEAEGAGRVVLTRIDELLDRYAGCLATGGNLREQTEGLREEWR